MWGGDQDAPETPEERRASLNDAEQLNLILTVIEDHCSHPADRPFEVTRELICRLNSLAVDGLVESPGKLRTRDVEIEGSRHEPPPWQDVGRLVDEMTYLLNVCNRVAVAAKRPKARTGCAFLSAGYAMWRLNWVHPFNEGNGRTARALSYIVLCTNLHVQLTGRVSILERITRNKFPYLDALEAADKAYRDGGMDITECAVYLSQLAFDQVEDKP